MKRHQPKSNRPPAGFTLIELLVVIAIIAILAGLLFPAFGRMQIISDRAKCASNLRQIGAAINSFVGEHDGYLPGPLWTWQNPWYKTYDFGALGTHLSKYLKLKMEEEAVKADILICPAWQRGAPYSEDDQFVQWIVNTRVGETCRDRCPPGKGKGEYPCMNPWGNAQIRFENDNEPEEDPFAGDKPQLLASLPTKDTESNSISASTIWAMQDYDQESASPAMCPQLPVSDGFSNVVPKPVHKDVRNTLFFDFHVEAVKVPLERPQ